MSIKAIDYENLKEGDLVTWYGVHVLRWEDEIRPYGIEPTIAFVQDDTLEQQNADLLAKAKMSMSLVDMIAGYAEDMPAEVLTTALATGLSIERAIAKAEGNE